MSDNEIPDNEIDNNEIRLPDLPYNDLLIDDELINDEDVEMHIAIQESLKIKFNKLLEEEQNKELERIQKIEEKETELKRIIERKNKLGKIYEKLLSIKYHSKDNLSNNIILFISILNKYINCKIDNYQINPKIYNNILYELSKIRIKYDELEEIKNIFKAE
jgi:hypothetical protein